MTTPDQWRQYDAEKARYERNLVEYHAQLEEWNSLTPEEKEERNRAAEAVSRFAWSLGVAALASWMLYEYIRPKYSGDKFWLLWSGVSIVVVLVAALASRLLGLLARATVISGVVWILSSILIEKVQETVKDPPSDKFQFWATSVLAGLSFLAVLLGGGRKTGAPRPPSTPTRPV